MFYRNSVISIFDVTPDVQALLGSLPIDKAYDSLVSNLALCYLGGKATGVCDPAADGNSDPATIWRPRGSFCSTSGAVPMCTPTCSYIDNPNFSPPLADGCGPTQVCVNQLCLPAMGVDAGT